MFDSRKYKGLIWKFQKQKVKKKFIEFLKKNKNAGCPINPRVGPYVGRGIESSPHSLCGTSQPDPHFTGQVRGRPTRFAIPNRFHIDKNVINKM